MLKVFARLPRLRIALPGREHWPATLVLATLAMLYVLAGVTTTSLGSGDGRAFAREALPTMEHRAEPLPPGPPPAAEPLAFREMAPQDAVAYNASIPVSKESNPAARPFLLGGVSDIDKLRSIDCLTAAVYYEAAIEPTEGQRAVAQVVLNRLRHPAFPKTVCGVVFQGSDRATGCQFTFTCDGSLSRVPSTAGWARARKVAEEALTGKVYKAVGYATHYHTNWVVPYWSANLTKVADVGTHIFYRWEGGWGRPSAFRGRYAGVEPPISALGQGSGAPGALARGPDKFAVASIDGIPAEFTPDMKGRAVVRRYEPLREAAAAASRAELAKADVPGSLRWALTGESGKEPPSALGRKPAQQAPAAAAPAAAVPTATK
jgi:spore germination cell wall hydrolase CwlJ-like protein